MRPHFELSAEVSREEGFSLVETMLAAALTLMVTATVFSVMHPAQGLFASQPEAADMQQRLRVAQDTLSHSLLMAGAGVYAGKQSGPLVFYFPPVMPFRQGARNEDPVGTFATDRITLLLVPSTAAQTVISQPLAPGALSFAPAPAQDGGCAVNDPLCGFILLTAATRPAKGCGGPRAPLPPRAPPGAPRGPPPRRRPPREKVVGA